MKPIALLLPFLLVLASCEGDDGDASPSVPPTATADAAAGDVCELIEIDVVTAMANAEAQAGTPDESVEALSDAQFDLQEAGLKLIDQNEETLGRLLLEISATVSKVRLGVVDGDSSAVEAFAEQARGLMRLRPLRQECGKISTGEA